MARVRQSHEVNVGETLPFQIAVHDGEEDLKEKVDSVDQHRKEEQPRFARHCD